MLRPVDGIYERDSSFRELTRATDVPPTMMFGLLWVRLRALEPLLQGAEGRRHPPPGQLEEGNRRQRRRPGQSARDCQRAAVSPEPLSPGWYRKSARHIASASSELEEDYRLGMLPQPGCADRSRVIGLSDNH